MRYLGTDNNNWKTWIGFMPLNGRIGILSTRTYSQSDDDERDSSNNTFQFWSWDRTKWQVNGFAKELIGDGKFNARFILQRV